MQACFSKSATLFSLVVLLVVTHVVVVRPAAAQAVGQMVRDEVGVGQKPPTTPPAVAAEPGSSADGAAVARSFAELTGKLEPGDTVYVTRRDGERTQAKVQGFDADLETMFFRADGVSFGLAENELHELELRYGDSLANGAVIGAVAGGGIFVIAGVACALVSGCDAASETFAAAALFGGIGAGIGAAIDASHRSERLVYVSPSARARGFAVRPVISRTRRGAELVIRF